MLAVLRSAGELPLFLHVLGSMALFGALGTVVVLALVGWRHPAPAPLARGSFGTLLAVALPSWVVMYVFAYTTKSEEHLPDGLNWIDLPQAIAHVGAVLLLVLIGIAYAWTRSPGGRWQARTLVGVSGVFIVALGVAWWVMTAKPAL
jgi:hypothetical protein